MPGATGLDLLKRVRAERPKLPVLVLSIHSEEHYAVRVLAVGAAGFISKESAPEELLRAIRRAREGGKYISPRTAETHRANLMRKLGATRRSAAA